MSAQEAIAFPDIEELLVGWVPTVVADVPVSTEIPNPRPSKFIRLIRTGGPRQGLVTDQPQVTFECWADRSTAASALAGELRPHVFALGGRRIDGHVIRRVQEFSGPANLPDKTSGQSRYTWSVRIDLRGVPLPA